VSEPFDIRPVSVAPENEDATIEEMDANGWRLIMRDELHDPFNRLERVSLIFAKAGSPFAVLHRGAER
jgi:hypothetical protein